MGLSDAGAKEVGISKVPVMPGSTLTEQDTFHSSVGESISSLYDVTTRSWLYQTSASLAEVQAFYQEKFPKAEADAYEADPSDPDDESEVTLWIPTDNPQIDELTILIYEGSYSIGETTRD